MHKQLLFYFLGQWGSAINRTQNVYKINNLSPWHPHPPPNMVEEANCCHNDSLQSGQLRFHVLVTMTQHRHMQNMQKTNICKLYKWTEKSAHSLRGTLFKILYFSIVQNYILKLFRMIINLIIKSETLDFYQFWKCEQFPPINWNVKQNVRNVAPYLNNLTAILYQCLTWSTDRLTVNNSALYSKCVLTSPK